MDKNYGYNFELPSRPNQNPEINEKRRKAMMGRRPSEACIRASIEANFGKKQTPEHKAKVRLAMESRTKEEKQLIYRKISESNKGKIMSEEARKKIGEAHAGTTHSEETKRKMSESHLGEKNPNYGRKGIDHWRFGTHHSEETIIKMRKSHSGKNNHNYEKTMPEEQKKKISETKKRIFQERLNGAIYMFFFLLLDNENTLDNPLYIPDSP